MQQTETYKLNLIETSDTFSPAPLNENAQKLEAAIAAGDAAEAAARAAAVAALDQRVSVLELHKCVVGYHVGSGTVDLGFTPAAIIASGYSGHGLVLQGFPLSAGLQIVEGGFEHNSAFANCRYIALA